MPVSFSNCHRHLIRTSPVEAKASNVVTASSTGDSGRKDQLATTDLSERVARYTPTALSAMTRAAKPTTGFFSQDLIPQACTRIC
jgi:hypothetical protein